MVPGYSYSTSKIYLSSDNVKFDTKLIDVPDTVKLLSYVR